MSVNWSSKKLVTSSNRSKGFNIQCNNVSGDPGDNHEFPVFRIDDTKASDRLIGVSRLHLICKIPLEGCDTVHYPDLQVSWVMNNVSRSLFAFHATHLGPSYFKLSVTRD